MAVKNYSINTCRLIFGGLSIKEGLVSFAIAPVGKRFDSDTGADGMVTRWNTNEVRHTCTLVLKGASKENQLLSAIHQADVEADNGAGIVVMSFTDEQGATFALTDSSWLEGMAEVSKAVSPGDVTWTIMAAFKTPQSFTIGGN
jgi:hypothetical protein